VCCTSQPKPWQEEITDDDANRRLHDPDVHRRAKGDEDADPTRHLTTGRDRRDAGDDRALVGGAPRPRGAARAIDCVDAVALAPQVDKLLQEQCYAYAKQAGLKEHEVQYSQIGTGQWLPKMVAGTGGGEPAGCHPARQCRGGALSLSGHLLEVTDLVEKLQQKGGEFFPISLNAVMYKGKAYGVPHQVSPWPLVTRLDILEAAKVDPPRPG